MIFSKSGALALNVGTGNQSVTGLGFTPKVIILQSTPDTSNIVTSIANMHSSIGAFDGTSKFVFMNNVRNGIITAQCRRYHDQTNVIYIADPAGTSTPDYIAAPVSLDGDGFTINITNAPPINYRFGYFALGGTDIANIKVGTFTSKGSTGLQSVATVGFQPDVLILFTNLCYGTLPLDQGDCYWDIGWANGPLTSQQFACGATATNGTSPIAVRANAQTGKIAYWPTNVGGEGMQASLISFDANGFTLNWSNHAIVVNAHIGYIAIKGTVDFKSKVGYLPFPNTTNGTLAVTGFGFEPKAGLFTSVSTSVLGTWTLGYNASLGWSDVSKNMFDVGNTARSFAGIVGAYHTSHDLRIYRYIDYSNSSIVEEGSLQTWDADGFTVFANKGTGQPSNTQLGYLVFSGVTPLPPTAFQEFGYII